jgi:WD40 repeat protein
MVLSCADDCALKLWDFKSGKCVRTLGNPHEPESTTPTSQQARCWLQQPAGSEVEASVGTKTLGDLPLGRRLKGHKDRVKTCCVFNASADGYAVLA